MGGTTARRRVLKVPVDGVAEHRADLLAVEEPLEIRVDGEPVTVTMRTPGDDIDLAAGFLFTEGLLRRLDAVHEIRMCDDNVAAVTFKPGQESVADRVAANRNFITTSACGVCGKDSIEAIRVRSAYPARLRKGCRLATGPGDAAISRGLSTTRAGRLNPGLWAAGRDRFAIRSFVGPSPTPHYDVDVPQSGLL